MRRVTVGIFILFLAALGAASLFACRRGPIRVLRVSQPRILDMAPLYVAMERGYVEKEGISIELDDVGSPREGIDNVVGRKSDISFAGDAAIAIRMAQGAPIKILCTINGSSHSVGLLMKKGPLKDALLGKKIGVRLWTSPHYFVDTFLLYNLIPRENVTLVEIEEKRLAAALATGEVDAVAGFQADLEKIRQKQPHFAVTFPQEFYRAFWVVVCHESLVMAEPETIEGLLRALNRGVKYILDHEEESIAIVSRYTGVSERTIREHFPVHHFEVSLDNSLLVLLEQEGEWGIAQGVATGPVLDYRKKIYDGAMKAVRPHGITIID